MGDSSEHKSQSDRTAPHDSVSGNPPASGGSSVVQSELPPEIAEDLRRREMIRQAQRAADELGPSLQSTADWSPPAADPWNGNPKAADEFIEGDRLKKGRYVLIKFIDKGSFGFVWKGIDQEYQRPVAIKLLKGIARDGHESETFGGELLSSHLHHPRIALLYDIGKEGQTPFLVYEFIEGQSLAKLIAECPVDNPYARKPREAARLLKTIANAVNHASQRGIVHRDLKSPNVIVERASGEPYVVDFGLSIVAGNVTTRLGSDRIVGTLPYMAPEQVRGEGHLVDKRTDVYSLGVILFHVLTGELPFHGRPEAVMCQIQNCQDEPPDPRKRNRSVPFHLARICQICMAKDRDHRFADAGILEKEIDRFLGLERPNRAIGEPLKERIQRVVWREKIHAALLAITVIVPGVMISIGLSGIDRSVQAMDRELTTKAMEVNQNVAVLAAQAAGRDIERQFQSIEDAARSPQLIRVMRQALGDPEFKSARLRLCSPSYGQTDRDLFIAHPARQPLQDHITSLYGKDSAFPGQVSFSWFVLDPSGIQLAREPAVDGDGKVLNSLGRNFAWRTYYHGGSRDLEDQTPCVRPATNALQETKLSASLFSEATRHLVIVVSAPVRSPEGEVIGVIGKMLELGRFAALPVRPSKYHFPTLVDTRPDNEGVILQHPIHVKQLVAPPKAYLGPPYRIALGELTEANANYRDPFGPVDAQFSGRWFSSAVPIHVHGRESGLVLLAQQAHHAVIGSSLGTLRTGLRWIGGVILMLIMTVIISLWTIAHARKASTS